MSNSSIWPIDRTLSSATTLSQSRLGSNGNEEVFHILQSSSITGASPLDCLVSYAGHSLGRRVLPLCRDAVGVFYSPSRLGCPILKIWGMSSTYSLPLLPGPLSHRVVVVDRVPSLGQINLLKNYLYSTEPCQYTNGEYLKHLKLSYNTLIRIIGQVKCC